MKQILNETDLENSGKTIVQPVSSNQSKFLLNLQGTDRVTLLEQVFSILERSRSTLNQMHQQTLQGHFSLLLLIEIEEKELVGLKSDLEKLDSVKVDLHNISEFSGESNQHSYILTLLGKEITPQLLNSLLRHLRSHNLRVKSISPLDADGVQVFEIKLVANQPVVRQR